MKFLKGRILKKDPCGTLAMTPSHSLNKSLIFSIGIYF